MPPRENFENDLRVLRTELMKLGLLIEQALDDTFKAFKSGDKELAKKVIENDRKIDNSEKTIESKCLSLILCQQPVARDLRVVSMSLKMVTDMERIGDHASDICEIMLHMEKADLQICEHIPDMAVKATQMVRDAVKAFIDSDTDLAQKTIKADDEVDELFNMVKYDVISILKETPDNSDMGIDFLMIGKYLERVADHAVNICEWIEFNQTGEYKNFKMI